MEVRTNEKLMFLGDELARTVWKTKYAQEDETHYDQMHKRMAKEFARVDMKYLNPVNLGELSDYGKQLEEEYNELSEEGLSERYYQLFKDFKYIVPQGSVMSQLGAKSIGSLSNCFVLGQPEDSYGGIMKMDEEQVQLMKRRGGVGIDISSLRPASAPTSNSAKSSTGAVSFAHRFSNTTREVAQNGRRGALMLSMDIKHPDSMDFITVKRDLTQVTGANISLKLWDEFMRAVENDEDYILRFPCDSNLSLDKYDEWYPNWDNGELNYIPKDDVYVKVIRAKQYWDEIIKSAHGVAEPGLMFWDTMVNYSPDGVYPQFKQVTTNPCCFSESCRVDVVTNNGIKDIRNVNSNDLVWLENEHKFVPTKGYTNYGVSDTYQVKFSNGEELILTNNHKLAKITPKRVNTKIEKTSFELTELKDLKIGDEIRIHNSESLVFGTKGTKQEGSILGWLSGDGCLSYANEGDNFPKMYLDFWENEKDTSEIILNCVHEIGFNNSKLEFKNNGNNVKRIASSRLTQYFTEKFETNIWKFRKGRNEFLYSASKEFIQGYLSAYFTADGTIENVSEQSRFNISLASIDKDRLQQVQSLLLNFGIKSSIGFLRHANDNKNYSFANSQDCFRLTITGITNIRLFYKYIGFITSSKQIKLQDICERDFKYEKSLDYIKIISIEYYGEEEVGCIEVPDYNYFTANSIISGNSEIAMQPYDACRLMVTNLFSFVKYPFTKKAYFDFDLFYKVNYEAMRIIDNLADLEIEHIQAILAKIDSDKEPDDVKRREKELWEKVLKTAKASRRTGLGFTALGDALAALGLKYDSDEALVVIESIMRTKMESEFECSIDMAITRGPFEGWDESLEWNGVNGNNDFYRFLAKEFPTTFSRMMQHGRRNVSLSTLAPTGTTSLMTQTTSGVEPLFMPFYKRRKKVNPNDSNARVDFTDQNGDAWQEYFVLHPKFKDWIKVQIEKNPDDWDGFRIDIKEDLQQAFEQSPWYGSTANDIDWIRRVEIQGTIQKYISHSISSTINLPNDVKEEEVSRIYLEAWKKGLKGITVYRDGSRSGVLVSDKEETTTFNEHHAPKRPKKLEAKLVRFNNNKEKWIAFVGMMDGKPYEIFTGLLDDIKIPTKIEQGEIVKVKEEGIKRYDFTFGEEVIEGIDKIFNNDYWNYGKLVSGMLRHGMPLHFAVEMVSNLKFEEDHINTWKNGVARALKKFISDGEVKGAKCKDCGSSNVIFEEGCMSCKDCGSSKCG